MPHDGRRVRFLCSLIFPSHPAGSGKENKGKKAETGRKGKTSLTVESEEEEEEPAQARKGTGRRGVGSKLQA